MRGWCAWLLVLVLSVPAWADGKMFQRAVVARPAETPDQRALLSYDEERHVETLVVETTVAGEGGEFAWVIALPAKPEIEPSTTGLFPSLAFLTAPEVVERAHPEFLGLVILALGVWGCVRWWRRPLRPGVAASLLPSSLVIAIFAMLSIAPVGCGMTGKSAAAGGADGATVLDRRPVGIFDTTTLTATDAASLRGWLAEHGFAAPAEMDPVVTDLLGEGWVFVASRVRSDGGPDEVRRLHPLAFTFPSREPVYPMRLTGVGGSPIAVDLFVCGPRRAEADGMTVEFCDTGVARRSGPYFHDELFRRAGGRNCLTKLTGRFEAAAMAHDVAVRWNSGPEERLELYTAKAAVSRAARPAALWFGAVLLLGAIVSRSVAACAVRLFTRFDAATFGVALVVGMTVTGTQLSDYPRVPDGAVLSDRWARSGTADALEHPPERVFGDVEAIRAWAREATSGLRHPVTDDPVREEDSPDNWWIRRTGEGLELVVWESMGSFVRERARDVSARVVLTGTLRASDGSPVAGAEVRIRTHRPDAPVFPRQRVGAEFSAATADDGTYRALLPAGRRWDVAFAPANRPYALRSGVSGGAGPLDVVLPRATTLRGRCLDSEGRPVAHARVVGFPESPFDASEERAVVTDDDGWFEIPGLDGESDDVWVGVHLHDADGECIALESFRGRLPPVEPVILRIPSSRR